MYPEKSLKKKKKTSRIAIAHIRTLEWDPVGVTYVCTFVQHVDKSSQQYMFDGKVTIRSNMSVPKKKSCCPTLLCPTLLLSHKTAVSEPSFDQLSVGDHIKYKFVGKKGKVQLWCGVVVSTDPDMKCRAGSASNELETKSKRTQCRHTSTTTKEASRLNTTDSDMAERYTAATLLFENSSSTNGKRQKRPSNSPLPGAEPKRERGE